MRARLLGTYDWVTGTVYFKISQVETIFDALFLADKWR